MTHSKKSNKKKPIMKVVQKDTKQTTRCTNNNCYDKSDNLKVLQSLAKEKKLKESDIFASSEKKK